MNTKEQIKLNFDSYEFYGKEIMKKEKDYMSHGKHWITYIPKVKIN